MLSNTILPTCYIFTVYTRQIHSWPELPGRWTWVQYVNHTTSTCTLFLPPLTEKNTAASAALSTLRLPYVSRLCNNKTESSSSTQTSITITIRVLLLCRSAKYHKIFSLHTTHDRAIIFQLTSAVYCIDPSFYMEQVMSTDGWWHHFNPLFHQLETTTQTVNFQLLPLLPITVDSFLAIDQQ